MEKHLPEADVTEALQDLENKFQELGRRFRKGYLSLDDLYDKIGQLFLHMTGEFLTLKGIHYAFSASGWRDFANAFHRWKTGRSTEAGSGEEWLFHDDLDKRITDNESLKITRRGSVYGLGKSSCVPASMEDKIQFFRIADAFDISPEYFSPMPENLHLPKIHYTHTYNSGSTGVIDFSCVSDDGLRAALSPAGKSFALRDDLGLTANVLIKEVRSEREIMSGGMDLDDCVPLARYLAEGTIEGYTSGRIRDITIRTGPNNAVCSCGLLLGNDDLDAQKVLPLWQDGFEWLGRKQELWKEMCEKKAEKILTGI